jgi:DNA repair protein RecO (recombination protein O)
VHASGIGFVLRTWPLRDSDLIVSLFTLEEGKLRGVAHRALRPRSRWAGACEPLTELDLHWRVREGQELAVLSEPTIRHSPYHPQPTIEVTWAMAFLAELVDASTAPHDAEPALHRLLRSSVDALLAGLDPFAAVRYAQAWVLRLAGVLPDLGACAACGGSLSEEGGTWHWRLHGLGCAACLDPEREEGGVIARPADLRWLESTRRVPPDAIAVPDRRVLRRIGVLLGRLLGEHLGGRELKSERFLAELERLNG